MEFKGYHSLMPGDEATYIHVHVHVHIEFGCSLDEDWDSPMHETQASKLLHLSQKLHDG